MYVPVAHGERDANAYTAVFILAFGRELRQFADLGAARSFLSENGERLVDAGKREVDLPHGDGRTIPGKRGELFSLISAAFVPKVMARFLQRYSGRLVGVYNSREKFSTPLPGRSIVPDIEGHYLHHNLRRKGLIVDSGTITEAQFLITELQYTLGQLHVQLGDLDGETLRRMQCGERSAEKVLFDLIDTEMSMQSRYAELLGIDTPRDDGGSETIALPVSDEDAQATPQSRFEHLRTKTIHMLEGTDDRWDQSMLDLVKSHVQNDRAQTTEIAECRKSIFSDDSRPDLEDALTTHPEPHVLAEESEHVDESVQEDTARRSNP